LTDRLTFRIDKKYYGIDTRDVYGIIEAKDVYFLPGKSGFVRGVISLRGETIAVLDSSVLCASLGGRIKASGKIIIIEKENRFLGLDITGAEIFFIWDNAADLYGLDDANVAVPRAPAAIPAGEVIEEVPCDTIFRLTEKILTPGRKNVIIADDMEFFRDSMREILTCGGFTILAEACNGEEAVDLAIKYEPELVILDIVMPKKNGLEAAREIKALPFNPKVVICSSLGDEAILEDAKSAGVDAYIKKPFTNTDFLSTVLETA